MLDIVSFSISLAMVLRSTFVSIFSDPTTRAVQDRGACWMTQKLRYPYKSSSKHALVLQISPAISLYETFFVWLLKTVVFALISTFLAWLGIRIMDALTPHIHQRQRIGEEPVSVGMFLAGFFIFIGLVIHGALMAPVAIGAPLFDAVIDFTRLGLMVMSFFVALLLSIALFDLMNRALPRIPFRRVNESSISVGIYVFGYLVFLGLILHAALTLPL